MIEVFGWEEKNGGVREYESSTMKEWRAPLLGQLPTAETGYDTLNLTVECMTMASACVCVCFLCGSCVVLFTNGKKQGSSIHFTKTVFELSRIKPTSAIHLPPLFSLCPTYTITRPHTDVCTYASKSVCTLNTGLFVHSASPVCADGEQIWSTWVSELWSRKWFLPWFGDEPRSCHPVIRQTLLK